MPRNRSIVCSVTGHFGLKPVQNSAGHTGTVLADLIGKLSKIIPSLHLLPLAMDDGDGEVHTVADLAEAISILVDDGWVLPTAADPAAGWTGTAWAGSTGGPGGDNDVDMTPQAALGLVATAPPLGDAMPNAAPGLAATART